jgi:outer membrane usher protein
MKATRILITVWLAGALTACANVPVSDTRPVDVRAQKISREYSSFDARIASGAVAVDHKFAASLDPQARSMTRLESALTHDGVRLGDAVSSAGMWGRPVRYGGLQLGNYESRSDVIAARDLATTGLAVLPTVADALFASVSGAGTSLSNQKLSVNRDLRPGGPRAWELTAQDAFGRSVAIDAPLMAPTRLADDGCAKYSIGIG